MCLWQESSLIEHEYLWESKLSFTLWTRFDQRFILDRRFTSHVSVVSSEKGRFLMGGFLWEAMKAQVTPKSNRFCGAKMPKALYYWFLLLIIFQYSYSQLNARKRNTCSFEHGPTVFEWLTQPSALDHHHLAVEMDPDRRYNAGFAYVPHRETRTSWHPKRK